MNLRKSILAAIFCIASASSIAATQVVSQSRVNLFLDSASPFSASDWAVGAVPGAVGNVKILKSTGNVSYGLLSELRSSGLEIFNVPKDGYILEAASFSTGDFASITGKGNPYHGQCADFVKVMLGSNKGTFSWYAGTKLSTISNTQLTSLVKPGTVIAYFNNRSQYPQDGSGHVAIVLSWSFDSSGKPIGITVADQNFLQMNVTSNGVTIKMPQTISKHFLPWTGSGLNAAGNYNIVDINWFIS